MRGVWLNEDSWNDWEISKGFIWHETALKKHAYACYLIDKVTKNKLPASVFAYNGHLYLHKCAQGCGGNTMYQQQQQQNAGSYSTRAQRAQQTLFLCLLGAPRPVRKVPQSQIGPKIIGLGQEKNPKLFPRLTQRWWKVSSS